MNARWTVSLAAFMAVFFCGALLASAAESNSGQNQSGLEGSAGIIQTSTLIGTTVLNPQSQKLGQIQDILLDAQTAQATFAVLDVEVPGSRHAMLVVPYDVLRLSFNRSDNRFSAVLDLPPDQLQIAPQIQNNQRQMLQNPQFLEQARNFYKVRMSFVARPIDNPSPPCPPVPGAAPQPRQDSYADWPQSLIDFSSE